MASYDVRKCDQCGETDEWDIADKNYDEFHHVSWLSVNWVKGPEELEEYDFCSFKCLLEWAKEQV